MGGGAKSLRRRSASRGLLYKRLTGNGGGKPWLSLHNMLPRGARAGREPLSGTCSVILKVGTHFSRSTALWHLLFPPVASGPWRMHSLAPLLELWNHDAGPFLASFTMKSRCAQCSPSLGRPLDSVRCLCWQPRHHCQQLCSQVIASENAATQFSVPQKDLGSVACSCHIKITF